MHVCILSIAIVGAWATRQWCYRMLQRCRAGDRPWRERWSWALGASLVPVLWLAVAVVAVGAMGTHGTMFGHAVSASGLWLSGGFAIVAVALLVALALRARRIRRELRHYPEATVRAIGLDRDVTVRAIAAPSWFAGQVGIVHPELAIGRDLLAGLDRDRLEAIVTHECAHARYRDTLVFFFLGWLRRLTGWLPHTRALWDELILLRELRADRWAAQFVDPLLLAETLVAVARSTQGSTPGSTPGSGQRSATGSASDTATDNLSDAWAGFHDFSATGSFEARIEALIDAELAAGVTLADREVCFQPRDLSIGGWLWCVLACFPLLALPFHHV